MHKALKIIVGAFFFISAAVNATPKGDPIIIGAIYNLTGAQSSLDIASMHGSQLAVDEINAAGGILGRPLKLNVIDGQSQENAITKAATKLAAASNASGVIIGLNDTDMALAAIPPIAAKQKLFVTTGATSPKLSSIAPRSVIFACFVDSDQANAAAEFAYEKLNLRNAYVLSQSDTEYSHLLGNFFQQSFAKLGGKIIASDEFTQDKMSITKKLKQLKAQATQPEIIYLAVAPSGAANIIRQIRNAGFKQPIIGGDSFDTPVLFTKNSNFKDLYYTTHAFVDKTNPDPRVSTFIDSYTKTYKQAPTSSFAALGYDAIKLVANAINDAQSTDADKIRLALLNTKNFDGITGTISFINDNPIPIKSVNIIKSDNNKKTFIMEWLPKARLN